MTLQEIFDTLPQSMYKSVDFGDIQAVGNFGGKMYLGYWQGQRFKWKKFDNNAPKLEKLCQNTEKT